MSGYQESTLQIDLSALTHNHAYLKSKLNADTKMLAVVKAAGYGSDAVIIAKHLAALKVDYLAVAYTSEGVALRDAGIQLPILVLHPQPTNFDELTQRCLEPNIYSFRMLELFVSKAKSLGIENYPIHLKFNTGLNRLGFAPSEVTKLIDLLKDTLEIKVKSVFTHLAASEDTKERDFTKTQLERFNNILAQLLPTLDYKPIIHATNTSGILNFPEAHYDMVRSGIGLYGYGNAPEYDAALKPVASLFSVISQKHEVKRGQSVGYNRAFIAKNTMTIATIPLGHADGISRQYGNGIGWVTIKGQKAPMVGNICMDMLMVDVSHIDCKEGDSVLIFGPDQSANQLAQNASSISYELLTAVASRIKRVVVRK
ncbi:MAG: alanine racemase [Gilvibacter sp.]